MRLLVDTDVLISWSKKKDNGLVAKLVEENHQLFISTISLAEFRAGVNQKDLPFYYLIKKLFQPLVVDTKVADLAGEYSFMMARKGQNINLTDHLIAATAYEKDLSLVTFNIKHFPHPGLKLYLN